MSHGVPPSNNDFTRSLLPPNLSWVIDTNTAVGLSPVSTVRTDMNHYLNTAMQGYGEHGDQFGHDKPKPKTTGLLSRLMVAAAAVITPQLLLYPFVMTLRKTQPVLATVLGAAGLAIQGLGLWKGIPLLDQLWRRFQGKPDIDYSHTGGGSGGHH